MLGRHNYIDVTKIMYVQRVTAKRWVMYARPRLTTSDLKCTLCNFRAKNFLSANKVNIVIVGIRLGRRIFDGKGMAYRQNLRAHI